MRAFHLPLELDGHALGQMDIDCHFPQCAGHSAEPLNRMKMVLDLCYVWKLADYPIQRQSRWTR